MLRVLTSVLTGVLLVLYPVAVWVALHRWSPRAVGLLLVAALVPGLALRFRNAKREDLWAVLRVPLAILSLLLVAVAWNDPLSVLAVPVVINLVLLVTFGSTLRAGSVPMIERFARLQEGDGLSAAQVAHCRQMTWLWVSFFALNGAVAAALAFAGPVDWWAVYNGGIAYGLMGGLFVFEYVLRQYRFRQYGRWPHDRLLALVFPPRGAQP